MQKRKVHLFGFMSKFVTLESTNGWQDRFIVTEYFSSDANIFLWPCALLLSAHFAAFPDLCRDAVLIELGAGVGLPSVVAARLGATQCLSTEKDDPLTQDILHQNLSMNNVIAPLGPCSPCVLNWGDINSIKQILDDLQPQAKIDLILGADILYSTEDFEPVLSTVAAIINHCPNAIFLTTYQQRSAQRSLQPYLDKYDLKAEIIPKSSFLGAAHDGGVCLFVSTDASTASQEVVEKEVPTFPDMFLIRISRQIT